MLPPKRFLFTIAQRQLRDPQEDELDALTLAGMKRTVMSLLHAGALEVNVVGDFDAPTLEALLLRYLGTVAPRPASEVRSVSICIQAI